MREQPITVSLSRNQYDTIVGALRWVFDESLDDPRVLEELDSCLRLLARSSRAADGEAA